VKNFTAVKLLGYYVHFWQTRDDNDHYLFHIQVGPFKKFTAIYVSLSRRSLMIHNNYAGQLGPRGLQTILRVFPFSFTHSTWKYDY